MYHTRIGRSTISELFKDKHKYIANENIRPFDCKRLKQPQNPLLEKCLMYWYSHALQGSKVSDDNIRDQAKQIGPILKISDFNYSAGWVTNFKKRFKLQKCQIDSNVSHNSLFVVDSIDPNVLVDWVKTSENKLIQSTAESMDILTASNSDSIKSELSDHSEINDAKNALYKLHSFCEQSEHFDSNDLRFLIRLKSKLELID